MSKEKEDGEITRDLYPIIDANETRENSRSPRSSSRRSLNRYDDDMGSRSESKRDKYDGYDSFRDRDRDDKYRSDRSLNRDRERDLYSRSPKQYKRNEY